MRKALALVGFLVLVALGAGRGADDAMKIDPSGNVAFARNVAVAGELTGVGMPPPGAILAFSGPLTAFDDKGKGRAGTPFSGWQLCSGENGAPDLRDRFLVAAGSLYKIGDKGGSQEVELTVAQIPSHDHGARTSTAAPSLNYSGVAWRSKGRSEGIIVNIDKSGVPKNRPNLLTTKGKDDIRVRSHAHGIRPQGNSKPHENRPPYYSVAFIMRRFNWIR